MKGKATTVWRIVLAAYSLLMIWLLFFREGYDPTLPYMDQLKFNLTPFATISRYVQHLTWANRQDLWGSAAVNLLGNIIMFIPLGFFLPRVVPALGKFWRTVLVTVLIITAVELAQLFTLLGSCDIDDLILNVMGAAIGYGIHNIIK